MKFRGNFDFTHKNTQPQCARRNTRREKNNREMDEK